MEMSKEPRVVITLRLSRLERDELIDLANKVGISLNEYLRFRLGLSINEKSARVFASSDPYLVNEFARQEASANKAGLCPQVSSG
jgi:hypothetical protein